MFTALLLATVITGQESPVATRAQIQAQSVIDARKARRASSSRNRAVREAREHVDYQKQLEAQDKAVKDYQAYVVKMGPIWAAEHANQIQQQRNALIAQQNQIAKYKADYEIWLLMQINGSRR